MATAVDICNMALAAVRADPIDDINEGSVESVQCNIYYDQALEWAMTVFGYPITKAEVALALVSGATSQEWDFVYDYPSDCMRALYIIPPNNGNRIINTNGGYIIAGTTYPPIPFEVVYGTATSPYILSNYEDAYLSYNKRIDERLLDALQVDLVAAKLATYIAIPLGGDSGKYYRDEAMKALERANALAVAKAANEGVNQNIRQADSIKAYSGLEGSSYKRSDGSYGVY